jgi:hypothetical protein
VAVKVRVEVSELANITDLGMRTAETPVGVLSTLRLMGPVKPLREVTVTVVLLEAPLTKVTGD